MKNIFGISLENFKRHKQKSLINRDISEIESNIKNILLTSPIERRFQKFNGVGLSAELFENASDSFISNLESKIKSAIEKEEPRVSLENVSVNLNTIDNSISILIYYKLIDEITEKLHSYSIDL